MTFTSQGSNQTQTVTITNQAGISAPFTSPPVSIDETLPVISGAVTTAPNAYGWYNSNVMVHWTVSDALSGVNPATVPADSTISGEGSNLSATASVSDKAGNTVSATVSGIHIDRTAPTTTVASISGTQGSNSWYTSAVTVNLSAHDSLSGLLETDSRINNGAKQVGSSIRLVPSGTYTVEYWSVDRAGNEETHNFLTVKVDTKGPTVTMTAPGNNSTTTNSKPTLSATATDKCSGVASVQFQYSSDNGKTWMNAGALVTSAPFNFTFSTMLANASYKARAFAIDNAGLSTTSAPVTFTVANPPPTVTVTLNTTSPRAGSTLTATFTKHDPDGEPVTLYWVWDVTHNGVVTVVQQMVSSTLLGDSFNLSLPGHGVAGDVITLIVTPKDPSGAGTKVVKSVTIVR